MPPTTTPGYARRTRRSPYGARVLPNGHRSPRHFLGAFLHYVSNVAILVAIAAAANRLIFHLQLFESCITLLVAGRESTYCVTDPRAFTSGIWEVGPQLPAYEHYALVLFEVATYPPVTGTLVVATVATAVLQRIWG